MRSRLRGLVPPDTGRWALLLYLAGTTVTLGALLSACATLAYELTLGAPGQVEVPSTLLTAAAGAFLAGLAVAGVVWVARRAPDGALVLAMLLFLGLRVAAILELDGALAHDWAAYDRLAIGWTRGAPPVANWPMGYPALLGEAYRVAGADPHVGEVLNLAFVLVGAALLAAWVSVLAGTAAAALAVALLAVAPSQLLFMLLVGTESVFTTATIAAVLLVTLTIRSLRRGERPRRTIALAAAAGIVLGVAAWVRPTSLVLALVLAALPLLVPGRRARDGATAALAIALGVAVMLVPVVAVNKAYLDRWSPSSSLFAGWQLYLGANVGTMGRWNDADRTRVNREVPGFNDFQLVHEYARGIFEPETLRRAAARDEAALRLAVERIRDEGPRLIAIVPFKFFYAWGPADAPVGDIRGLPLDRHALSLLAQMWWIVVLAGATGWFVRRGRSDSLPGLTVSAAIVPVALSIVILQTQPRYHEYVVPLVAGLAAISLAHRLVPPQEPG
jgi:hypothetical protein